MAKGETIYAIDLGSQRVTLAELEVGKGITLKKYQSEEVPADPAAESGRLKVLQVLLAQMAKSLAVKKGSGIRYSVPGHAVITKFVKLPPIESEDLEELVCLEAQQQIPFSLEEGVWDWAEMEKGGIEKEVVIVAIKRDAVDSFEEIIGGLGTKTVGVDSAPTALYNAFCHNYGELTEPVLIVDVGARTTDLLYVEGKQLFSRSVNLGGVSVTSAIAKDYGITFAEAEGHKVNSGMVSMGHTEGMDEGTAALATSIRNSLNRLPQEISRTTTFYRSKQGGNAPTKLFLSGGGASLPYLAEFLQEKLQLPVELFNALRNVKLGAAIDSQQVSKDAHLLGETIGLGVGALGQAGCKIDLVPTQVQAERNIQKRKPWLVGAAAILLVGALGWTGAQFAEGARAAKEADEMEARLFKLQPEFNKIQSYNAAQKKLEVIGSSYAQAQTSRTSWIELIDYLRAEFASDAIWITKLEPLVNYTHGEEEVTPLFQTSLKRANYGETSLEKKDSVGSVNALKVEGFWRENSSGQRVVTSVLGELKKGEAEYFDFTKPAKRKGKREDLQDSEILININSSPEEDTYAAAFTMILPLKKPFEIK